MNTSAIFFWIGAGFLLLAVAALFAPSVLYDPVDLFLLGGCCLVIGMMERQEKQV